MRAMRQSAAGRFRLVVVAFVPVRIGHNGLPADFVEGDLLRAVAGRGGDRNDGGYRIRISDGPFERLHAAHGPAGYRKQSLDAQMLDQRLL